MTLIKGHNAGELLQDAIVLDLGDLRRQADRMKEEAKAEAARLVAEGRAEAQRLTAHAAEQGRTEGYQQGLEEGRDAGRQSGHAEALEQASAAFEQLQHAWTAALEQYEQQRRDMILEARRGMIDLALAMAAKVVRRVPQVDPTIIADQVAEAIDSVVSASALTVRMNPEDRPIVAESLPTIAQRLGRSDQITLVDDAGIERGGCVVSYGRGRIDATLDRQLERLIESLLPDRRKGATPLDASPDANGHEQDEN